MRVIVVAAMVLGFAVSPALARPAGAGDKAATTAAATSGASAANTPSESATASKSDSPAKPAESNMENELQELRDLIEAQSKQIQVQNEALKEQQQQMQTLENQLKISSSVAVNAAMAAAPVPSPSSPSSPALTPNAITSNAPVASSSPAGAQKNPDEDGRPPFASRGSPSRLAVTSRLKPCGATARGCGHQLGLATAAPLPSMAPRRLTSRNSVPPADNRASPCWQRATQGVKIGGYYEMDFLSAGTTSNHNQSNSYTLRQRQFWAQAEFDSGLTLPAASSGA